MFPPVSLSALGLHLAHVGRYLADHDRRLRAPAGISVLFVDDHRCQEYFTGHVQSLGHVSEDAVVAVQERGVTKSNIEPAGGRVSLFSVTSADRSLLVGDLAV